MSPPEIELGADTAPAPAPPDTESLEQQQEGTREWIAITLLLILAGILLALFCSLWARVITSDQLRGLAGVLIAPIIGLIGSVIGFYFGTKATSAPKGGSQSG